MNPEKFYNNPVRNIIKINYEGSPEAVAYFEEQRDTYKVRAEDARNKFELGEKAALEEWIKSNAILIAINKSFTSEVTREMVINEIFEFISDRSDFVKKSAGDIDAAEFMRISTDGWNEFLNIFEGLPAYVKANKF
jgi:hypothetical protein